MCWCLFNACVKRFRSQPFFTSFHDTFEDVFGRRGGGITIELGSWEVISAFSKKAGSVCIIFDGQKLCVTYIERYYAKLTSSSI